MRLSVFEHEVTKKWLCGSEKFPGLSTNRSSGLRYGKKNRLSVLFELEEIKYFSCFVGVMETRVKVEEEKKRCGNTWRQLLTLRGSEPCQICG